MRILILEDEKDIANSLKQHLSFSSTFEDAEIELATHAKTARRLVNEFHYDLISIDILLPDGNGLDLVEEIRNSSKNYDSKILVLTTQTQLEVRLGAFNDGADDYLPKPFLYEEFVARMVRLIGYRRVTVGKWVELTKYAKLNVENKFLMINGTRISLTDNETSFLKLFVDHALVNFDLARDVLSSLSLENTNNSLSINLLRDGDSEEKHYCESCFSDEAIRMLVSRLRKKIKQSCGYELVKTVVGKGYRVELV